MPYKLLIPTLFGTLGLGILIGHIVGTYQMYAVYGDALSAEAIVYLASTDAED